MVCKQTSFNPGWVTEAQLKPVLWAVHYELFILQRISPHLMLVQREETALYHNAQIKANTADTKKVKQLPCHCSCLFGVFLLSSKAVSLFY